MIEIFIVLYLSYCLKGSFSVTIKLLLYDLKALLWNFMSTGVLCTELFLFVILFYWDLLSLIGRNRSHNYGRDLAEFRSESDRNSAAIWSDSKFGPIEAGFRSECGRNSAQSRLQWRPWLRLWFRPISSRFRLDSVFGRTAAGFRLDRGRFRSDRGRANDRRARENERRAMSEYSYYAFLNRARNRARNNAQDINFES